ncbi:MAG: methyl-accepting chemotaxis protein [Nitrospirae bacterium]|nr:methyl-accepting chemotaxis protein [Magnetococcales bacterium]
MSDNQQPSDAPANQAAPCAGNKTGKRQLHPSPFLPVGNYDECNECSGKVLSEFAKSFDKSARRWELIVYPSLFSFIILAMYGFFLIFSLTQDIRIMASSIDPQMGFNMGSLSSNIGMLSNNVELMSTHLEYISDNMETMSVDMQNMADSVETMSGKISVMADSISNMEKSIQGLNKNVLEMNTTMTGMGKQLNSLTPMAQNLQGITQAMHAMTGTIRGMGHDMNGATRPMSFINHFMPW